jgi:hypothetical protein
MLTLLSPVGLWALAALSLPLALHLWRRPPRTVRLGSLRYLERLIRHRPRDLRWRERLLLAVRLLLLALLALMLTRPHWRPPAFDRPQHWALIDPNAAPQGDSLARLRALQAAGYETHSLAAGFPQRKAGSRDAAGPRPAPDLWSLLREADAGLPKGSALAVFTSGRLASLRGDRPALSRCRVEWVVTPDRAAAAPGPAPKPPAAPLNVVILHEAGRTDDARYLEAAVRAVAQVSGREMSVTVKDAGTPDAAVVHADWAFWLGNQPPPESLGVGVANLVTDAEDDNAAQSVAAGWIVPQPGTPGAEAVTDNIRLWRRVPARPDVDEAVLWTDSFGKPLLTQAGGGDGRRQAGGTVPGQSGTGSESHLSPVAPRPVAKPPGYLGYDGHRRWRFFSRFNPDWTDLPRTAALPAWLRALLLPETDAPLFADPIHDLRRADPAQLPALPAPAGAAPVVLPLARETPGLQGWCWLLAAILFGLERLLSHLRRRPSPAVAKADPNQTPASVAR